jgi:serine/threonine-protein kinase RsbW
MGSNSIAYRGDGEGGGASRHAAAPTAGVLRWRQVFSGDERSLRDLRHWLASLLPACPACDDVISVANELASNAIQHTASGRRGKFAVEITRHEAAVRVTVADGGAPAEPRLVDDPTAENGRGLLLVRGGLSLHAGVFGGQQGRVVWAEITWDIPDAPVAVPYPHPGPARGRAWRAPGFHQIRRLTDALARFGPTTHAWH